jgi:hypothetical protein
LKHAIIPNVTVEYKTEIMRLIHFSFIMTAFTCIFMCGKESSVSTSVTPATGKAGSTARFAIKGNYLYTLEGSNVVSYDITNGSRPEMKNKVNVGADIETLYPYNDLLFIGSQTGMYAYSLADPARPERLSVVSHVRACDPVVAQGDYAYVTLRSGTRCGGSNELNVYNVSNLFKPVLMKSIAMYAPNGLGVEGNALYVTNASGISLFNIAQPASPVLVQTIVDSAAADVIPYNNTLIVQLKRGASFYDISNTLQPVFQSRISQ